MPYLFTIGLFIYLSPVYGDQLQTCLKQTTYFKQNTDDDFEKDIYLGLCYLKQKDTEQGLYWLEKTANNGSFYAQEILGLLYKEGSGTLPKSDQLSQRWFTLALQTLKDRAQHGDTQAMAQIAFYYQQGRVTGQPENQQAWYWYQQWAKQLGTTDPNFLKPYAQELGIDNPPEQEQ